MSAPPPLSPWARLEQLVQGARRAPAAELVELAQRYREACAVAARLRAQGADDDVLARLDGLLARAHNALYRAPPRRLEVADLLFRRFPHMLRQQWRFFAVASAVFWVPFVFGLVTAALVPAFASGMVGPVGVESMRAMYEHAPQQGRSVGESVQMVSFYIQHNISIAFQVFAAGAFAGVGTLVMLAYQGVSLGTVFGLLLADDKGANLLLFTCGHSAWELTAIVVAGTAGLRLGWAWVAPGVQTRMGSVRRSRHEIAELVLGAAWLLFVAALIEGLWSASSAPPWLKIVFAIAQVGLVVSYLSAAGRPRGAQTPAVRP